MKLLKDNILITPVVKEETDGIQLAEATNDFIAVGLVEEVAEGLDIKKGDKVRVSKFAGEEFEENGKRYKIISAEHVLAIE